MRVFVGIKISEEINKKIIDWQEKHKTLSVRWIKEKNLQEPFAYSMNVHAFTLFSSRLLPSGAEYESLATIKF